jgi:hypothetical protein
LIKNLGKEKASPQKLEKTIKVATTCECDQARTLRSQDRSRLGSHFSRTVGIGAGQVQNSAEMYRTIRAVETGI